MFDDVLRKYGGIEVGAMDVYANIFSLGDGQIQKKGKEKESRDMVANPIVYFKYANRKSGAYRVLFEDDFEEMLKEAQKADFAILNGITYFGRRNKLEHSSRMFALIFDLDGCTDDTVNALCYQCSNIALNPITGEHGTVNPMPNYIIMSGDNLHLYYIFEEPVPLYPEIKLQMKELKYALTRRLWNRYTSTIEKPQYQGINQGFRPVGGKTKDGKATVRAFQMYDHPYSLDKLNSYVPEESRVNISRKYAPGKFSRETAKEKWPEWYQKVIVEKDNSRTEWAIEEKVHGDNPYALYDWWIRQIMSGTTYGHRYFGVMALAIYAAKCHVSEERLEKDAYGLIEHLNSLKPDECFNEDDVKSALECYDSRYCTFPRADIEKLTAIIIPPNKRNGRKQDIHLAGARAVQEVNDRFNGTNWRDGNGRKSKEEIVTNWQKNHPEGKKAECIRETGLDKKTVYKHWKIEEKIEKMKPDLPYGLQDGREKLIEVMHDSSDDQRSRLLTYAERMKKMMQEEKENE